MAANLNKSDVWETVLVSERRSLLNLGPFATRHCFWKRVKDDSGCVVCWNAAPCPRALRTRKKAEAGSSESAGRALADAMMQLERSSASGRAVPSLPSTEALVSFP